MHVLISRNPMSGRKSSQPRAERLAKLLRQQGLTVEISTDLDEVTAKANELHAAGRLRVLVGVGGDGTAAELLNRTNDGVPLTLLPAGNANLLAKLFKIGFSPARLADMIAAGRLCRLDVGRANGRFFLVTFGAGFDAEIVEQVHATRKERFASGNRGGGHVTNMSYVRPILRVVNSYRYPKIHVEAFERPDDESPTFTDEMPWAFVFNMNRYAWGLPLVPGAKGDDGRLDHCLLAGGSMWAGGLYVMFAQVGGLHRYLPGVRLGQAVRYRIQPADAEASVAYQIDGDPGGRLTRENPVEIDLVPRRLTFLVPPTTRQVETFTPDAVT